MFALSLASPHAAQAQAAPTAQIGEITARQENGRIQVEIAATGNLQPPRIGRMKDPDRLVLNFTGAVPKTGYSRFLLDKEPVLGARISLFRVDEQGSAVTRVVLDLTRRVSFQTSMSAGKFIVSLDGANSAKPAPQLVVPAAKRENPATPPAMPTAAGSTLNDIAISQSNGQTTISLAFNQAQKPRTMYLESPRRFVLDFPGAAFGAEWMKPPTLRVNSPAVSAVRSSLFREQPPTIRVVFDQAEGGQSPKISVEGNSIVVQFSDQLRPIAQPHHVASAPMRPVRAAQHETATPPVAARQTPETVPTPQPSPASASIRPQAVSGMTVKPPTVFYQDGLLTVDADNTMLIDVLYAIGEKTGAAMEVPMAEPMLDRVAVKIGPRKPREVISTIMEGSGFNYFIIEDSAGRLQKVVLTPKEPSSGMPQ